MKNFWSVFVLLPLCAAFLLACGGNGAEEKSPPPYAPKQQQSQADDPLQNKGIGPVKEVKLGPIDEQMVAEGKALYEQFCTACHKPDEKFIGPAPKGILQRRSPEWIMNMILNPEEMVQKDPIAKKLLVENNLSPMANQHLTQEQARKILEYFRTLE
ncbi:MAG: cytochrome c [Bacteroidetes bacterium]|nr:MAG: cytochrome c [Bacteroidota bacterium]